MTLARPDRAGLADARFLEHLAVNSMLAADYQLPSGRILSGAQVHAWLTADDPDVREVRDAAHWSLAHDGWNAA